MLALAATCAISTPLPTCAEGYDRYVDGYPANIDVTTADLDNALFVIHKAVTAINESHEYIFAYQFTYDASITDDMPPYYWYGFNAPVVWFYAYQNAAKQIGLEDPKIVLGTPKVQKLIGDRAYESIPATLRYRMNGEERYDEGTLVFLLTRIPGSWQISSMTWTR